MSIPFAEALQQARVEYPEVGVSDEEFSAWLTDRFGDAPLGEAIAAERVGDLLLACGCDRREPGAVAAIERVHMPTLQRAIAGVVAEGEADEVLQRVRERLLVHTPERRARIVDYRGDGPLRGWLRVCAVREALGAKRKRQPDALSDDVAMAQMVVADPELALMKENASAEFRTAFAEAVAELPDRDKNVLRYHALDGLKTEDVARIYRVDRSTVSRWLAKARHRVLAGTRRRLTLRLRLDHRGFESLMDLIASRLDVSLGGLDTADD